MENYMNQDYISHLIQHYASTGIIHNALVPFYDQHGRWRGGTTRWKCASSQPLLAKIKSSLLPSWRRTRKRRSGITLRTSFYWTGAEPFRLRYGCIEGSLIVSSNAMIYAANLRHVGGHFITSSNLRIHLPCLASVAGNFEAMQSFHVAAPLLRRVGGNVMLAGCLPPSLETVAGRLGIYGADSVYAACLRHVGGCLVISKANEARLPLLETVNGGLLMTHPAKKIDVPGLRIVGGDFLAGEVTDIRAPRLEAVIGHLETSFAMEFYHPRIKVGGDWTVCPGAVEHWAMRAAARLAMRDDSTPFFL
jgi:hypothetical protein